MKKILLGCLSICLFLISCDKKEMLVKQSLQDPKVGTDDPLFTQYQIAKGEQYCNKHSFVAVNYSELKFDVRFDSTAIYKTIDPANQGDINKLYGFSDNNSDHHQNSARFGWRWSDNALRLFAYVYNNGKVVSKELGVIDIGVTQQCSIKVMGKSYVFTLNNFADTITRSSITTYGAGYKLYPYFGGDEVAPHTINLEIREALP